MWKTEGLSHHHSRFFFVLFFKLLSFPFRMEMWTISHWFRRMRLYLQCSTAIFSTFLCLWNLIEDLQTIWNPTFKGSTPIKVTNDNHKKRPYQIKSSKNCILPCNVLKRSLFFASVCFNLYYYEYQLGVSMSGKNLKTLNKWKMYQA